MALLPLAPEPPSTPILRDTDQSMDEATEAPEGPLAPANDLHHTGGDKSAPEEGHTNRQDLSAPATHSTSHVQGSASVVSDKAGNTELQATHTEESETHNGPAPSPPPLKSAADEEPLERLIRDEMALSADPDGRNLEFLPQDKLDTIITDDLIIRELAGAGCHPDVACVILGSPNSNAPGNPKQSRVWKRIFTTLVLIEKVSEIHNFIKEDIDDSCLPFERAQELEPKCPGRRGTRKVLHRRDGNDKLHPIKLFTKWKPNEMESFETQQWKVCVPVFRMAHRPGSKPPHYKLEASTILPYVKSEKVGRGGFSAVERVEIYSSHHDGHDLPGQKQHYAVKKLNESDDKAFKEEVSNLSRFVNRHHPHLIRLLCTFTRGRDHHLVFPSADGNLMDFWRKHQEPLAGEQSYVKNLWFARQCLGIVEGLCMIHQDDNHEPGRPRTKIHGRHGDLKPENILWFQRFDDEGEGYSLGVLKISDFGLTRFHGTYSRSRINAAGGSPTYRAPEYDVFNQTVSQSYDIWSLACVLLEFVTWFLRGWEEVDKFSSDRKDEDEHPEVMEDTFFNFVKPVSPDGGSSHYQAAARAKKSVVNEFQTLYEHPNASDFTLELVEFIEKNLLRMKPSRRAKCHEIKKEFQKLYGKCRDNPDYCLKLSKTPPLRKDTDLSLLTPENVELSEQMSKQVARGGFHTRGDGLSRTARNRRGSESRRPGSPLKMELSDLAEESDHERNFERYTVGGSISATLPTASLGFPFPKRPPPLASGAMPTRLLTSNSLGGGRSPAHEAAGPRSDGLPSGEGENSNEDQQQAGGDDATLATSLVPRAPDKSGPNSVSAQEGSTYEDKPREKRGGVPETRAERLRRTLRGMLCGMWRRSES